MAIPFLDDSSGVTPRILFFLYSLSVWVLCMFFPVLTEEALILSSPSVSIFPLTSLALYAYPNVGLSLFFCTPVQAEYPPLGKSNETSFRLKPLLENAFPCALDKYPKLLP
jgi:hypothetical protein